MVFYKRGLLVMILANLVRFQHAKIADLPPWSYKATHRGTGRKFPELKIKISPQPQLPQLDEAEAILVETKGKI